MDLRPIFTVIISKPVRLSALLPSRPSRPAVFGGLLAAVALGGLEPARAQIGLSATSPFLPGPSASAESAAAPDEYQLAGASKTDKTAEICIYDARSRRSRWIAVGATEAGIQVISYDAANDLAVVKVNGAQKLLSLRKPTVVARATAAFQPLPVVLSGTPGPVAQNGAAAVDPSEAGKAPEVVKQEKEARMLVSDLLEIGLQQRKAYEEAQKKADAQLPH